MTHNQMPKYLAGTIAEFMSKRKISMSFEGQTEKAADFLAGLPQGSPLYPVLFILYASALKTAHTDALQGETIYVDDTIMIQGASSPTITQHQRQ